MIKCKENDSKGGSVYQDISSDYTKEHEEIRAMVHAFSKDVLRPKSLQLDALTPSQAIEDDSPLWEVFRGWYQLEQHCASLPNQFGGANLDPLSQCIIFEELGWGASDLAISLGVASFPFLFLSLLAADPSMKNLVDEIVGPFAKDREGKTIGCWAITEPNHGSDELGVGIDTFSQPSTAGNCRATFEKDHWTITGQKSAWVSNGTIASHALLFCTIEPSHGMEGGGIAIVPLNLPGVKKGAPLDKIGQRALNQGEIHFDSVEIPQQNMIVGEGAYSTMLNATLATANSAMALVFTGLARAAFEEALEYAKERIQGGKPIAEHQMIQQKLFAMFTQIEQSRSLSRLVFIHNAKLGIPVLPFSIAAKVSATRCAFNVASEAIQIFGGIGLTKGTLVEKFFRDARASLIEDGVNEFLELVGAKELINTYNPN